MRIKVSGFSDFVNKYEIKRIFSKYGTVNNLKRAQNENIAHLEMPYELQGKTAIKALDGSKLVGQIIKVEECV